MKFLLPSSRSVEMHSRLTTVFQSLFSAWLGEELAVEVVEDYNEMAHRLVHGEAHMAWGPPQVCARVQAASRAVLKSVRRGRSSYQSALVVRKGQVNTLAQLEGKRASWVDPLSSGGYLLPTGHLRSAGIDPESTFSSHKFCGSYKSALVDLVGGEADLATVYVNDSKPGSALENVAELLGRDVSDLAVLDITAPCPSDGLVLTKAMTEAQVRELIHRLEQSPPLVLYNTLGVEELVLADRDDYNCLR